LRCRSENCSAWYPIVRGIPRMLPEALLSGIYEKFAAEWGDDLKRLGLIDATVSPPDDLSKLKGKTIENFGFEWLEYARFGWDDPVYNIQKERNTFLGKALLGGDELPGRLVLDAGCGNGRYSHWAASLGGKVFGLDLGWGVESAAENTAQLDQVQIVQGDIFALPFAPKTFDLIFSIGVLMHTGDARRAIGSLSGKLKEGGSLSAHVYGRGNPIYEALDGAIRWRTTRMSIKSLRRFTKGAYQIRRGLEFLRLANIVTRFIRLDSHPHCIFDWYAAPIATHHSSTEVNRWFADEGLQAVANSDPYFKSTGSIRRLLRRAFGSPISVTVRGVKD
jgi:SAM-dependent methyltransferase